MSQPRRVAVVGGGIAGLTAARDLAAAGHAVVVFEAEPEVGGKLRRRTVGGVTVDVGAEAMLRRRPEGVELATELGLSVVSPAVTSSMLWTRGELRALPRSLMGVPLDLNQLAQCEVLSPEGLARALDEPNVPVEAIIGDVSVGELVARRFGDEVTDRLVEPLLGGVYAGRSREISARATIPQLVTFAERGSLTEQAATMPGTYEQSVFAGLAGGMSTLVDAILAEAAFTVYVGTTVFDLRRAVPGFSVEVGPTDGSGRHEVIEFDGVVVASPAATTAKLLSWLAPIAAGELERVQSASVAVVTLAFRATDLAELAMLMSSGFLVPPIDGRRIKASTFSFAKWDWVREAGRYAHDGDDVLVLRTSLGRIGEDLVERASDEELVRASLEDLREAIGLGVRPIDAHVERWLDGLPQYALGHLDRMARVRAAVADVRDIEVCGAAYDGVGIPAVIASAHQAAAQLFGPVTGRGTMGP